jgi:predicted membrane chloride channel (bestrophin family)
VCAYQSLQESGALPFWAPHLELSDGPLELTSFALSLLLVFRTDSSYARWNDALKVWSEGE